MKVVTILFFFKIAKNRKWPVIDNIFVNYKIG